MVEKFDPAKEEIVRIIELALAEDISHGDVTSEVLIPPELNGKASILFGKKAPIWQMVPIWSSITIRR